MLLKPFRELASDRCYPARPIGARDGITLHFDDSATDTGAVAWFTDPACRVSYNRLYLDDGRVVQITPSMEHAAWHNGACTVPNANRRFYGLAAATNARTPATSAQIASIVHDCTVLFRMNGWAIAEIDRRIVGHEDICAPKGRKFDPTGHKPNGRPVLSTDDVRTLVRDTLQRLGG